MYKHKQMKKEEKKIQQILNNKIFIIKKKKLVISIYDYYFSQAQCNNTDFPYQVRSYKVLVDNLSFYLFMLNN